MVRVGFVVLCVCFFFLGLVAYLALAILVPSPAGEPASDIYVSPDDTDDKKGSRRNLLGWALVGGGLLIAFTTFTVVPWENWWLVAPALVVTGSIILAYRSRPA